MRANTYCPEDRLSILCQIEPQNGSKKIRKSKVTQNFQQGGEYTYTGCVGSLEAEKKARRGLVAPVSLDLKTITAVSRISRNMLGVK
jgi:hypothetical protein